MGAFLLKNYTYVAKDKLGKTLKGAISAENSGELMRIIHSRELFLLSYSESVSVTRGSGHKFKLKELAFICRQLSSMLTAGMSLVKSLDILYKEQASKKAKAVLLEVYEQVQKGSSLSQALNMQSGAFPEFFISMVAAGEASGSLDTVMGRLSDHYAKENRLNNKIKSATTYPIILSIMALVVVIGLFAFIMPTFMDMFENVELPMLTRVMIAISDFVRGKWYVLIIIAAAIFIAIRITLRTPSGRLFFDRSILSLPKVGKLITKVYTGRFARTLSSLYSSGISMVECLEKSASVLGNQYINKAFEEVIDSVKRGETISNSISKTNIFESMFCSILYVGEESGALDDILVKTSDYYEEESDSAITRLVGLLEPVLIIFLGALVGLVIASILPAMYTMMQGIS